MVKKNALTPRQERFCHEFANGETRGNATQSAIKAGYAEKCAKVQGSVLLTYPNVSARVNELQKDIAEQLGIDRAFVLAGLKDVFEKCTQVKEVEIFDHETKQMIGTGEYVFDSRGANRALELLGKDIRMFIDRVDHTSKGKQIKTTTVNVIDPKWKSDVENLSNFLDNES